MTSFPNTEPFLSLQNMRLKRGEADVAGPNQHCRASLLVSRRASRVSWVFGLVLWSANIECIFAQTVPGNLFQVGPHPNVNSEKAQESPIVGGVDAGVELLQEFSDADLNARDCNRRSPLIVAAVHRREGFGYALLIRAKNDVNIIHRIINARDRSRQTVLTVAISSGCSLPFKTALLDNRAEYEPSTMPLAMTPLQTA